MSLHSAMKKVHTVDILQDDFRMFIPNILLTTFMSIKSKWIKNQRWILTFFAYMQGHIYQWGHQVHVSENLGVLLTRGEVYILHIHTTYTWWCLKADSDILQTPDLSIFNRCRQKKNRFSIPSLELYSQLKALTQQWNQHVQRLHPCNWWK